MAQVYVVYVAHALVQTDIKKVCFSIAIRSGCRVSIGEIRSTRLTASPYPFFHPSPFPFWCA
jgi:hypothetical protein